MLSKSIKEVIQHLKEGQITPQELYNLCLRRARKVKELNAYITLNESPECSHQLTDTPVHDTNRLLEGIPIAFKDNFCTRGIRTSCGSRMLAEFSPPYTATVVDKCIQHGASVIGKANMDEFAMGAGSVDSASGPVRNPWRYRFKKTNRKTVNKSSQSEERVDNGGEKTDCDWFITGGSSGGSAVAVASGTCFGAFGSDTGGSTRVPASFCGVTGLKPTYGRLSRHGLIPLVNSMDVPGIIGRRTDDVATILNAVSGWDEKDSTTLPELYKPIDLPDTPDIKGLRIGIPQEYLSPNTSQDVVDLWQKAADLLDDRGAVVSSVSLPHTQYSIIVYSVLCCCEVASNMARYDGIEFGHRAMNDESTEQLFAETRHFGFNKVVRGRIMAGNYYLLKENYERYFMKAQRVRRLISEDFSRVFTSGVDLLLTPTTVGPAPLYSDFMSATNRAQSTVNDVYTQPANLSGIPALTVPAGLSRNNLPIGLQILGPRLSEESILTLGKWIEQEVNFPFLNLDYLDNDSDVEL